MFVFCFFKAGKTNRYPFKKNPYIGPLSKEWDSRNCLELEVSHPGAAPGNCTTTSRDGVLCHLLFKVWREAASLRWPSSHHYRVMVITITVMRGCITAGRPVVSRKRKVMRYAWVISSPLLGTRTTLTIVKSWVIDGATMGVWGIKLLQLEIRKWQKGTKGFGVKSPRPDRSSMTSFMISSVTLSLASHVSKPMFPCLSSGDNSQSLAGWFERISNINALERCLAQDQAYPDCPLGSPKASQGEVQGLQKEGLVGLSIRAQWVENTQEIQGKPPNPKSPREGKETEGELNHDWPSCRFINLLLMCSMHLQWAISTLKSQKNPDGTFSQKVHIRHYLQVSTLWYERKLEGY